MDDPNAMHVIRLNQIILSAQRIIQEGGTMQDVWNALYVPNDLKNPLPPCSEKN